MVDEYDERRQLGPNEIEYQREGSIRIAPGIWCDRAGGVHYSIPELLAHFDMVDTPENRAAVERTIHRSLAEARVDGAKVVRQEPRRDEGGDQ